VSQAVSNKEILLSETIYLDHAATTPVDSRVAAAMWPYWTERYGNSASIHAYGRAAAKGLEAARGQVADVLGCHPTEIIFTGGGTESDNLALRGVAWAAREAKKGNHIITSAIEHHAVGHTAEQLQDRFGFDVTVVPVDEYGRVDPDDVGRAMREDTILISIVYANNEVGTIQPVTEIGRIARAHRVLFHTDAVQAAGKLDLNVGRLKVDLLTLSAHKFYGPKGSGILYVQHEVALAAVLTGGGQERGQRPGTINVAGSVGLATALDLAEANRESETTRLVKLRDHLIKGVLSRIPDAQLTGHPMERLADHTSFAFKDCDGEMLVLGLDLAGIAASTGSACAIGDPKPSFVLTAMGLEPEWGTGSLRLTLGCGTTAEHIERVLDVLPAMVEKTRQQ
jgi:cysteine desulfurase